MSWTIDARCKPARHKMRHIVRIKEICSTFSRIGLDVIESRNFFGVVCLKIEVTACVIS